MGGTSDRPGSMGPQLASYVAGWREREAAEARAKDRRERSLRREVEALARQLRLELGATRVILFGSLARGETTAESDVDLLVEGLEPARWIDAAVLADRLVREAHVDLVPASLARPEVRRQALAEGQILDG